MKKSEKNQIDSTKKSLQKLRLQSTSNGLGCDIAVVVSHPEIVIEFPKTRIGRRCYLAMKNNLQARETEISPEISVTDDDLTKVFVLKSPLVEGIFAYPIETAQFDCNYLK